MVKPMIAASNLPAFVCVGQGVELDLARRGADAHLLELVLDHHRRVGRALVAGVGEQLEGERLAVLGRGRRRRPCPSTPWRRGCGAPRRDRRARGGPPGRGPRPRSGSASRRPGRRRPRRVSTIVLRSMASVSARRTSGSAKSGSLVVPGHGDVDVEPVGDQLEPGRGLDARRVAGRDLRQEVELAVQELGQAARLVAGSGASRRGRGRGAPSRK